MMRFFIVLHEVFLHCATRSQLPVILPPRGHVAMNGDIFEATTVCVCGGGDRGRMLLASSRRPGKPLTVIQ